MIKDNQTRLNRLHVLLDALVIAVAYVFSWFMTLKSGLFGADLEAGILPTWFYMRVLVVVVPVYLLLYTIFHLFKPKRVQGRRQEFANICKANLIGLFLFGTILYLGRKNPYLREFSARFMAGFFLTNIAAETLERNLIRTVLRSMRAKGYNQKHIILWATAARRRATLTACWPIRSGATGYAAFWMTTNRGAMTTAASRSSEP